VAGESIVVVSAHSADFVWRAAGAVGHAAGRRKDVQVVAR
jgi:LmbE family N-acetylglucosaminyl deacetylase